MVPTTDFAITINRCNQLPWLTIRIAVEGANEHAYDHGRENNAADDIRASTWLFHWRLGKILVELDALEVVFVIAFELRDVEVGR